MLTVLVTSGIHVQTLAGAPDMGAAIRGLAGDAVHVPDWAIPRLIW